MVLMIFEFSVVLSILMVVVFLSGNICEFGWQIVECCCVVGYVVYWQEVDDLCQVFLLVVNEVDLVLLGCWIDNVGCMLVEMKVWVVGIVECGQQLCQLVVFGIGEMQWGQEYYCGVVYWLICYFCSDYLLFEIEQMLYGECYVVVIDVWIDVILVYYWSNYDVDY